MDKEKLLKIGEALRPKTVDVTIGEETLTIRGLTSAELSDIIRDYPTFGEFMDKQRQIALQYTDKADRTAAAARELSVSLQADLLSGAFPAMGAAAVGHHGQADIIEIFRGFQRDNLETFSEKIMGLTFPSEPEETKNGAGGPQPPQQATPNENSSQS